jgi:hypothetical protein
MPAVLALYAIGLAYVITGDSVAARDPRRFWWAIVGWPVMALPALAYAVLKRM